MTFKILYIIYYIDNNNDFNTSVMNLVASITPSIPYINFGLLNKTYISHEKNITYYDLSFYMVFI